MPLAGVTVMKGRTATFRDCVSQLELEVAREGAFSDLRRRHRQFGLRGTPALTRATGYPRRVPDSDPRREIWVFDQVVSVNPDKGC